MSSRLGVHTLYLLHSKAVRRFALASFVALAGMIGCGINALGTAEPAADGGASSSTSSSSSSSSSSGGATGDASVVDADIDAADAEPPLATCKDLPASWGLVAYVTGTDPCPAGFAGGTTELADGPKTRADTCTCACALTAQPTCGRGSAGATYDNDNSGGCALTSSYGWNPAANGGCSTDMWPGPYTTSHDWKFSAPSRSGGTCATAADKHVDRLDFTTIGRACVPTAGCEGAPAVAAPAKRCIMSAGDVACPTGSFTNRTVMGKTFAVTCAAGNCGCAVQGTCANGAMTFYTGANCTGTAFSIAANGTCQASTANNVSVVSYKYTATVNGAGCTTSGTASATASTTAVSTICCE